MSRTAIVILNYNGEKLLHQFLPSVIQHAGNAEIIITDNSSTDGSISLLQQSFPTIRIIQLDKNYGFCGGYNRALKQVESDYYVLLNSDVEVTANWLEPMESLLDKDFSISAVQPKILSFLNKNKFEYAGAAGGFIDSLGYPFCRGRIFDHVEEDRGEYNNDREIFWATGACMMIRSKTFHMFGGFDEDFFAHMEEIDLCWKLHRAQQKVFYCGKSLIYHLGAGTLGYEAPRKTYLNFRNGLSMLFKHLETNEMIYKLPVRIALDWIAALLFLIRGESRNFVAVSRAHVAFLGNISNDVKELRRVFPSYTKASIYKGLIVFDYYLKGKRTFSKLGAPLATTDEKYRGV